MTDNRRFVVREHRVPDALIKKFPELNRFSYRVWDTKIDRMVPFGQYPTPDRAQSRADREERKAGGS